MTTFKLYKDLKTTEPSVSTLSGADPGFQVRGVHLKKLRRVEGNAKIVGVFRVKNHDFTPKNHIFSNFRGACAGCAPPPAGSAPAYYIYLTICFIWVRDLGNAHKCRITKTTGQIYMIYLKNGSLKIYILGVNRRSTNITILSELGKYPLHISLIVSIFFILA